MAHNGKINTSKEILQNADGKLIEYNMNYQQYITLIANKPKNIDNIKYVIDIINATYGLNGTVVKLNIER